MFHDLNVNIAGLTSVVQRKGMYNELVQSGYHVIALTLFIGEGETPVHAKEVVLLEETESIVQHGILSDTKVLKQLKRISITAEHMDYVHAVLGKASGVLDSYDIISIRPESDRVFEYVCEKSTAIQIITIPTNGPLPYKVTKALVDKAVSRNIVFEICYSDALTDVTCRRYFMSNFNILNAHLHGKHILLSSGTSRSILLRSPHDVMNMGMLLQLTLEQARNALSKTPAGIL